MYIGKHSFKQLYWDSMMIKNINFCQFALMIIKDNIINKINMSSQNDMLNIVDNQSPYDYELVKNFAQSIGLSNMASTRFTYSPYIVNQSTKRQRIRTFNHSDLRHLERQQVSNQVRLKNKMMGQLEKISKHKSHRKNSIKDVFIEFQRPQNNPKIILKNRKAISRKDYERVNHLNLLSQQLRQRAEQKHRRSKILGDLTSNLVEQQPFIAMHRSINDNSPNKAKLSKKWFKNPLAIPKHHDAIRPQTAYKLATSFDLSKFNLKQKKEGLYLSSNTYERNVQTSRSNRKKIKLRCNSNNKFEMQLSKTENRSFKLFQFQDQSQN